MSEVKADDLDSFDLDSLENRVKELESKLIDLENENKNHQPLTRLPGGAYFRIMDQNRKDFPEYFVNSKMVSSKKKIKISDIITPNVVAGIMVFLIFLSCTLMFFSRGY